MNILIGIIVFIITVLLIESVYLIWQGSQLKQNRKIAKRIRSMSAAGGQGEKVLELLRTRPLSSTAAIHRFLSLLPRVHSLDRTLQQSGHDISVGKFIMAQLILGLAILIVSLLYLPLPSIFSVVIAIACALLIPIGAIKRHQSKRQEKLSELFPDALEFMARSLRAGNPFSASLKAVAEGIAAPIGPEFGITFDEINYGLSVNDALYNMRDRMGTEEVRYFITAVIIQKQTGGNLASLLKRIAEMIRRRVRTHRDIKTQAAEMKISANVLIALPLFAAAAILVLNPNYLMSLVDHPVGPYLFIGQATLLVIGYIIIQRMTHFRV